MRSTSRLFTPNIVSLATAYDDQSGPSELVIPESFDGMEYAAVVELHEQASAAFNALYSEGLEDLSPEDLDRLATLTDGVEALAAEVAKRDADKADRAEAAGALAARVAATSGDGTDAHSADTDSEGGDADGEEGEGSDDEENEGEESEDSEDESEGDDSEGGSGDSGAARTVTASGAKRSELRVPLSGIKRKSNAPKPVEKAGVKSVAFAAGDAGTGYAAGEGVDFTDMGRAIDRKLGSYNAGQYANAAGAGRHLREQHGIATFQKQIPADLTIDNTDREHVDAVISKAVDQSRLPQGGLVAAGGWCAPSETMYDLLELETRSGMLSLPEVGISRGGISFTPGPSFADIYSQFTGFQFTEQNDIDGAYQPGANGNVEGPKPCVTIECPDFEEVRLEAAGLCIQAGLLMSRGYPEVIARTIRGALVAHEHRMNGLMIQRLVAGSTAVNIGGDQAGTVAPTLDAIEKQSTHYRYTHRLPEDAVLEAVFPIWFRGAMRADLARRHGLEVFEVTNQRLNAWLQSRQIAPQWVYNWQAIDGTAPGSFTAWPTEVSFLLYAAGTWVRGSSDIITLDTLYDSTLLGNNDYTALFTEEGWLVAKRGFDSRVVTVPICQDGGVAAEIALECDGTRAALALPGGGGAE